MNVKYGWYLSLFLVLLTLSYGLFQARTLLEGPELTIKSPLPGATQTETLMVIEGNAQNVTQIRINGETITTDPTGDFSEMRVTPDGYGVILVEAENRFGYQTEQRIELYGTPPALTEQS